MAIRPRNLKMDTLPFLHDPRLPFTKNLAEQNMCITTPCVRAKYGFC